MTELLVPLDHVPTLNPKQLDAAGETAVREFIAAGTSSNTLRSYASAMRYWAAWFNLRYGQELDGPVSVAAAIQFTVDHLERVTDSGDLRHELPRAVDERLVQLQVKAKPGPLTLGTVRHRLAVLSRWHRLHQGWENPLHDHRVKALLTRARVAQSERGVAVKKKTAATLDPLQAMVATCTDGTRGLRDRALLLLAWSGGRRRSEVVGLKVTDLRAIDDETWVYALGHTKTHRRGDRREKPLRGSVLDALRAWLDVLNRKDGPLFPRLFRKGVIGEKALTPDYVARIVKRRAALAGLDGDWAAHSLRSGFVRRRDWLRGWSCRCRLSGQRASRWA